MKQEFDTDYWDSIVIKTRDSLNNDIWLAHSRWCYQRILETWLENSTNTIALKTDLYDEAVTPHNLIPLINQKYDHVIGTDISFEVAESARKRLSENGNHRPNILVTDTKNQAFQDNTFDRILSNSTLDHFKHTDDLLKSLKELRRILKPDGILIITLDNPLNPVVFIRNHLPYRLLKKFGIISFYVGATLSRPKLVKTLEAMDFRIEKETVIIHSPRIIALKIGALIERSKSGEWKRFYITLLRLFECLKALPTRDFTGYFVAVKAIKRPSDASSRYSYR